MEKIEVTWRDDQFACIATEFAGRKLIVAQQLTIEYGPEKGSFSGLYRDLAQNAELIIVGYWQDLDDREVGKLIFKVHKPIRHNGNAYNVTFAKLNLEIINWTVDPTPAAMDLAFVCASHGRYYYLLPDEAVTTRFSKRTPCPTCKAPAYIGFSDFECSSKTCKGVRR